MPRLIFMNVTKLNYNKYTTGSGVGCTTYSNRSALKRRATNCCTTKCAVITNINLSDIVTLVSSNNNTSILECQSLTIQMGDTLVIPSTNVFNNYGTIIINGTIINNGIINNYGTIYNNNIITNNSTSISAIAIINNYNIINITNANSIILNETGSVFNNKSSGRISNFGRISQRGLDTYGVAVFNNDGILKNTGINVSITIENYFVFINNGIIYNNDSGFGMNGTGSLKNYNIIFNYNNSYINIQGGCTFENYGTLYNGDSSCGGTHPSFNSTPNPLGTVIIGCPP